MFLAMFLSECQDALEQDGYYQYDSLHALILLMMVLTPKIASQVLMAVSGTPQKPCRLLFCPVRKRLVIFVTTGTCDKAMC